MRCDFCDDDASIQLQSGHAGSPGAWVSRMCDQHIRAAKNQADALGVTSVSSTSLLPAVAPTNPEVLLSLVNQQLKSTSAARSELERELESERRSHADTRARLVSAEISSEALSELAAKVAAEQQAHHETHLRLVAMKETQDVNRALKEQLERVTAELERVTTAQERRPVMTPQGPSDGGPFQDDETTKTTVVE